MVEQYFMINAVRTALYDENFGDYNEKVRVRVRVRVSVTLTLTLALTLTLTLTLTRPT